MGLIIHLHVFIQELEEFCIEYKFLKELCFAVQIFVQEMLLHLLILAQVSFLIACRPSIRLSVRPSTRLSSRLSVNFYHFHLLLTNHWAYFNQNWHNASFGEGNSSLFKWRATPFSKERYLRKSENSLTKFTILLKNQLINFNQTWHKASIQYLMYCVNSVNLNWFRDIHRDSDVYNNTWNWFVSPFYVLWSSFLPSIEAAAKAQSVRAFAPQAKGWVFVFQPRQTLVVKTGSDSSTAKRSVIRVSVMGPRRWPW